MCKILAMTKGANNFQSALHRQLYPSAWPHKGLSPLNKFLVAAILASVLVVILETEPIVAVPAADLFAILNIGFAGLFTLEYIARVWSVGSHPDYAGFKGRIKFIFSPASIIDILAIIPFYLTLGAHHGFFLRLARVFRILALARLGLFSRAHRILWDAVYSRRYEIMIAFGSAATVMVISASIMFLAERGAQPEAFGSIPRALWWAVISFTTVGYGDVYPITIAGKLFAGITAIATVAFIAMPTGILAAAFSEAFQRHIAQKHKDDALKD